jgi:hypothetical protein
MGILGVLDTNSQYQDIVDSDVGLNELSFFRAEFFTTPSFTLRRHQTIRLNHT